jgi:alanyl-tRNA synthetase
LAGGLARAALTGVTSGASSVGVKSGPAGVSTAWSGVRILGGGGGGGPTMAQAGGGEVRAIPTALTMAKDILARRLADDAEV